MNWSGVLVNVRYVALFVVVPNEITPATPARSQQHVTLTCPACSVKCTNKTWCSSANWWRSTAPSTEWADNDGTAEATTAKTRLEATWRPRRYNGGIRRSTEAAANQSIYQMVSTRRTQTKRKKKSRRRSSQSPSIQQVGSKNAILNLVFAQSPGSNRYLRISNMMVTCSILKYLNLNMRYIDYEHLYLIARIAH